VKKKKGKEEEAAKYKAYCFLSTLKFYAIPLGSARANQMRNFWA